MSKIEKMIGKRFGNLVVISQDDKKHKDRGRRWWCKCDCGKFLDHSIKTGHLNYGGYTSCGCYKLVRFKERTTKHGLSNTRFYLLFYRIKKRCLNKNSDHFYRYGGRGITIYKSWIDNPVEFVKYIEQLENSSNLNMTLDRIDNDKGYEPGNLKFSTTQEQSINKSSTKLNWAIVKEIRDLHSTGEYNQTQISKKLKLSYHLVNCVVNNKSWVKNE